MSTAASAASLGKGPTNPLVSIITRTLGRQTLPEAASCVAALVGNSPTRRPSFITSTRSVMPSSSGISDEMTMMDLPCAAKSRTMV